MPSLVCRFQVVSMSIRMLGILIFLLLVTACGRNDIQLVKLDGSSTVFPISEAMAEEYQKLHSDVRVTVGISGTGGGFKKFCRNETDINDASRPIKAVEEETGMQAHQFIAKKVEEQKVKNKRKNVTSMGSKV